MALVAKWLLVLLKESVRYRARKLAVVSKYKVRKQREHMVRQNHMLRYQVEITDHVYAQ